MADLKEFAEQLVNLTVKEVKKATKALWKAGVTSYFPTIITSDFSRMKENFSVLAKAMKDPELKNAYSQVKKWFRDNSVEVPSIGLWSNHSYFSRLVFGKWFIVSYFVDPIVLNGPKNNFFTEKIKFVLKYISIKKELSYNFSGIHLTS